MAGDKVALEREINCCNTFFESEPKKSVCATMAGKADGVDKIFKATAALLRANDACLALTNASPEIKEGFKNVTHGVETARGWFAFTNVFRGVIPGTIENVKNIAKLITTPVDETVKYFNVTLLERREYTGRVEKILAGAAEVGYFVGGMTYIIGFGLLSPIRMIDGCFKNQINDTAREMGKAFPFVMMINHFGVMLGTICDMIRETIVDWSKQTYEYIERMVKLILQFIEKAAELVIDLNKFFSVAMPQGVIIIMNIVLSCVSCYRVWRAVNVSVAREHEHAQKKDRSPTVAPRGASMAISG